MNNFFANITKVLKLKKIVRENLIIWKIFLKHFDLTQVLRKIKKAINTSEKFSFRHVKDNEVRNFIMNLDGSKTAPVGDILTDVLIQTIDVHLP